MMRKLLNIDRAFAPAAFRLAARAAILATGVVAVGPALADTVRCESINGRERFCYANTRRGVELVTQLSSRGCYQNETWGYDNRGIWVSAGCRAIFETGYYNNNNNYNNYHSNNNYYSGDRNNKSNDGAAAAVAIGAILGAAVIASAASGNKNNSSNNGSYSSNYNRGCDYGRRDRQAGKSRAYYNHSSAYNSGSQQAFESGYNKCWNSN